MCHVLTPFVRLTRATVDGYLRESQIDELAPILRQPRIGKKARTFLINKFVTLKPETDEPINERAAMLRRRGLDELAQIDNIRSGEMSIFGWRPLIPRHHEQFRELLEDSRLRSSHDALVQIANPGIISSYGIYLHQTREHEVTFESDDMVDPESAQTRAEMNLKDAADASLIRDLRLVQDILSHMAMSRFSGE